MRNLFLLLTFIVLSTDAIAQEIVSFDYKKGEVLDILLVNRVPNAEEYYARYRTTALPVAADYSFELMSVLSSNDLLLGTPSPSTVIIGKWDSKERRESFLKDIVGHVPDFHQQRRDVFSYFVLTYYEMKQDITFSIDRSKYTIGTSFWSDNENKRLQFEEKWKNDLRATGGNILLTLTDGTSPTGYYYNPNTFYIIEWENEEQFREFASKYSLPNYEELQNVHQFSIN